MRPTRTALSLKDWSQPSSKSETTQTMKNMQTGIKYRSWNPPGVITPS